MSTHFRTAVFLVMALFGAGLGTTPARAATGFLDTVFGRPQQLQNPAFQMKSTVQPLQDKAAILRKAKRQRELQARRRRAQKAKLLARTTDFQKAAAAFVAGATRQAATSAPAVRAPSTAQEAISKVLQDETLRPGDAYMAADGLRVFVGAAKKDTAQKRFVAIDKAHGISPDLRARLAALEHRPPARPPTARPSRARAPEHSSVQIAMAKSPDNFIVDARGRTIRVVGETLSCCGAPLKTSALDPAEARTMLLAQR
ncbi:MAG: hypothetical protein JWM36_3832 [Hyphomicrobiales bacterium]|nr:hypothetical protein [Hyphomicrobiales bacterium]